MNFGRPSNFRKPRTKIYLSTRKSALQTKMEVMEKSNSVLRENMSNMETKLQDSLMINVLLEEKIHEMNTKHDDLEYRDKKIQSRN